MWMILNPRELDAVRDAIMRAKQAVGATSEQMRWFWQQVEKGLSRDELTLDELVFNFALRQRKLWRSQFHAGVTAILSAADRH